MATTELRFAPKFVTVRSGSGAVAADNATINDTNYPLTLLFFPGSLVRRIMVYWTATGVLAGDTLDLEILHRDGDGGGWKEGEKITGVPYDTVVVFNVYGNSGVAIRVVAEAVAAGTDLVIRAAADPPNA